MSVLSSFVWGVADTLRGPYSEAEYGAVILPFTVLRRLGCVMVPHREVMAEIVSQYQGEQQRRTHLKIKTRSEDNSALSFWTTSDYTLKKALQDPDNLAENLMNYVGVSSPGFDGEFSTWNSLASARASSIKLPGGLLDRTSDRASDTADRNSATQADRTNDAPLHFAQGGAQR